MEIEIKLADKVLWSADRSTNARVVITAPSFSGDKSKYTFVSHKALRTNDRIDIRLKNSVIEFKSSIALKNLNDETQYKKNERIVVEIPSSYQFGDNANIVLEFVEKKPAQEDSFNSEFSAEEKVDVKIEEEVEIDNIKTEEPVEIKEEFVALQAREASIEHMVKAKQRRNKKIIIFTRNNIPTPPKSIRVVSDISYFENWYDSTKNSNILSNTILIYIPADKSLKFSDKMLVTVAVGGYICENSVCDDYEALISDPIKCIGEHIISTNNYSPSFRNILRDSGFYNIESLSKMLETKNEGLEVIPTTPLYLHWPFKPTVLWQLGAALFGFELIETGPNEATFDLETVSGKSAFQKFLLDSVNK